MTEILTQKSTRDAISRRRLARVRRKAGDMSAKLVAFAAHHGSTGWESDSSVESGLNSDEEERLARESTFIYAAMKGRLRRHRSYDDLLHASESFRITKYSTPLSVLDPYLPFPNYPTGVLPSHLETKTAIAQAYRKKLTMSQHQMTAKSFASLVDEASSVTKKAKLLLSPHSEAEGGAVTLTHTPHTLKHGGAGTGYFKHLAEKAVDKEHKREEVDAMHNVEDKTSYGSGGAPEALGTGAMAAFTPKTKLGALIKGMAAVPPTDNRNDALTKPSTLKLLAAKKREADLQQGRDEVKGMQNTQRLRRRQSFPSPFNSYWRANKIKGGVI